MAKNTFTTNWHIYRACLPKLSEEYEEEFLNAILTLEKHVLGKEPSSLKISKLGKRSFNHLFLEAVDETLSSLGESSKEAIYFHLENNFKIARADIPLKVEEFAKAIENIFGFGAKLVEIQIMKRLYAKIGGFKYYPKDENLSFTRYANVVKMLNHIVTTADE